MMHHRKTKEAARGSWRSILLALGMDEKFINGRNGPCPCCGGTDRWQWVNDEGHGGGVCRQCGGKADGIHLVAQWRDIGWKDAAALVDGIIGNEAVKADPVRRELTPEEMRVRCRKVLSLCKRVRKGDVVDRYLAARGIDMTDYPATLATAEALPYDAHASHPAMVAVITAPCGENVSLHRTFLQGTGKLPADDCRKVMPGKIAKGSAVRLFPLGTADDVLGVAEGIETALSASALFGIPVWAVLNTSMMRTFQPPAGIREVAIMSDNDVNGAGQAADDALRQRLSATHAVTVHLPPTVGTDWNDELLIQRGAR